MTYYRCVVCSMPFQTLSATTYCSERCYVVDGMAYYYQYFTNSTPISSTTASKPSTSIPANDTTSNWSSWSCSSYPTKEYDTNIPFNSPPTSIRKNKTLPPPTLSPILMPTLSSSSTRRTSTISTAPRSRSSSITSANSIRSGANTSINTNMSLSSNNDEGEDSSFAYWPKFDSCLGSTFDACLVSNGTAQWDPISMNWATLTDNLSASASRSELPPPPSAWEKEDSMYGFELEATPRKYLALSASIWGPGWHQVEPLPPSFIKTLELNELELQAQAQALALEKAALATANPKAIAKRAKREAKAAAAAAAKEQREGQKSCDIDMTDANATSQRQAIHSSEGSSCQSIAPMNALCSSRLPRSLQFVD